MSVLFRDSGGVLSINSICRCSCGFHLNIDIPDEPRLAGEPVVLDKEARGSQCHSISENSDNAMKLTGSISALKTTRSILRWLDPHSTVVAASGRVDRT